MAADLDVQQVAAAGLIDVDDALRQPARCHVAAVAVERDPAVAALREVAHQRAAGDVVQRRVVADADRQQLAIARQAGGAGAGDRVAIDGVEVDHAEAAHLVAGDEPALVGGDREACDRTQCDRGPRSAVRRPAVGAPPAAGDHRPVAGASQLPAGAVARQVGPLVRSVDQVDQPHLLVGVADPKAVPRVGERQGRQ